MTDANPSDSTDDPTTESEPVAAPKEDAIDRVITSIRAALTPGASSETRALGTSTCRAVLMTLEGQTTPRAAAASSATAANPAASAASWAALLPQLGAILPQLGTMPKEQLREVVGAVMRGVFPNGRAAKQTTRYRAAPVPPNKPRPSGGR